MTRFVELHTLHHVPPSLLNRDDTGAHKRQMLGGVSRLSLSPQSQKRACRTRFEEELDIGQRGMRTGILPGQVRDDLVATNWDEAEATAAVKTVFDQVRISTNGETTPNLLFVPALARAEIVALCQQHRAELAKAKLAKSVMDAVKRGMANAFNPGRTVAIALAGRMVADPKWDMEPVEAALSISHAIGTNAAKAGSELDDFTAVDDAKQAAEIAGAGHIGMKEYGSTVFYRFCVVDVDRLTSNLDGDGDVAELALATHLSTMPVTLPGGAHRRANSGGPHAPDILQVVASRCFGFAALPARRRKRAGRRSRPDRHVDLHDHHHGPLCGERVPALLHLVSGLWLSRPSRLREQEIRGDARRQVGDHQRRQDLAIYAAYGPEAQRRRTRATAATSSIPGTGS